ncbi:MAG: PaaI family thioesterase [Pseudomonadota bacterium]
MNIIKLLSNSGLISAERRLEWFPPFRNLGIRVLRLSADWRQVRILLPLQRQNRNPGGSMFGGAIACLADPIPALACNRLFPGHAVWTRQLQIDFVQPGTDDLVLDFDFNTEIESQIDKDLTDKGRSTPSFEYGLYLPAGELSARVKNWVAIRPLGDASDKRGAMSISKIDE